jgi:hypothetical protein
VLLAISGQGMRLAPCEANQNNPDFDEREPFDQLLDEVGSLADAMGEGVNEGAPGISSACSSYFCSSAAKTKKVLKSFMLGEDRTKVCVDQSRCHSHAAVRRSRSSS